MRLTSQTPEHLQRRNRPGAAAVELAIALPLLLLLALGCLDLGRVASTALVLNHAVAAGSLRAATRQRTLLNSADWEVAVRTRVSEEMQQLPDFDPSLLSLDVTVSQSPLGETVVALVVEYPFAMIVDYPGLPGEFTLRETATCVVCR